MPRRVSKSWFQKVLKLIYDTIDGFRRLKPVTRLIILGGSIVLLAAIILVIALPKGSVQAADMAKGDVVLQGANVTGTATPTPEAVPTATPDPTLKPGDENDRVQQLQERLMDLDYMDIDESTKLYGPATKLAVQLFQRQNNIQQDGIAGPATLDAIFSDAAPKYTLLQGTRGEDVNSLQRQLKDLGYLSKVTGYYGDETVAAVKEFQKRNNLGVDGKTGQQTLDLIYSPNAKESATKAKATKRAANITKMVQIAQKQLGKPYILGNEGPKTFDCSGLVYYCLKQAGSSRGRYNAAGYSQVSDWKKITSMSALQKGDLIFYWNKAHSKVGHVAIYIGGGTMVDASSSNGKVVRRSCMTAYWKKMFVCGRRPW